VAGVIARTRNGCSNFDVLCSGICFYYTSD